MLKYNGAWVRLFFRPNVAFWACLLWVMVTHVLIMVKFSLFLSAEVFIAWVMELTNVLFAKSLTLDESSFPKWLM